MLLFVTSVIENEKLKKGKQVGILLITATPCVTFCYLSDKKGGENRGISVKYSKVTFCYLSDKKKRKKKRGSFTGAPKCQISRAACLFLIMFAAFYCCFLFIHFEWRLEQFFGWRPVRL